MNTAARRNRTPRFSTPETFLIALAITAAAGFILTAWFRCCA